jgi:hypothetical protein
MTASMNLRLKREAVGKKTARMVEGSVENVDGWTKYV